MPENPLHPVSTDTTGPINPPDLKENVFLQLVVDAATGYTQGFPMKRKAEAADVVLKGIRRL